MGKRYKEFLIDIIVKSYQIIFAVMIITPIATKTFDVTIIIIGAVTIMVLIVWGGTVSAKMEA